MTGRVIRIAVLDDHLLVAEGLASVLASDDVEVAVTASAWADLVANPAMPVDVAVLDLHLNDGILISTKVRALNTMGTAAVVISRHADAASVNSALAAGALAFVAKADSTAELTRAIRAAAAGEIYVADHHASVVATSSATPDPGLGRQEERALVLYASGLSIREVAADMNTTEETVKSYIKRGRRKYRDVGVDIGTRILLRKHAVREGWLTPEATAG
ncbi:MAG: DNA-binding response regulator [Rhodoglobus sp.]|nr:DNA-binding response regulator [Rhodoglobus sp.]